MTEASTLDLIIVTYMIASPIVSFVLIMHGTMEWEWDHPLYFGRRKDEKGIVSICRWVAISLFAPVILGVWFGYWSASKVPNFAGWLTEEP